MSDELFFWAAQQHWGHPADKLAMMLIAKKTYGRVAYGVSEDAIMKYANVGRQQARITLRRLQVRGHIFLDIGRDGPGFVLGVIERDEPIVLRMREN